MPWCWLKGASGSAGRAAKGAQPLAALECRALFSISSPSPRRGRLPAFGQSYGHRTRQRGCRSRERSGCPAHTSWDPSNTDFRGRTDCAGTYYAPSVGSPTVGVDQGTAVGLKRMACAPRHGRADREGSPALTCRAGSHDSAIGRGRGGRPLHAEQCDALGRSHALPQLATLASPTSMQERPPAGGGCPCSAPAAKVTVGTG